MKKLISVSSLTGLLTVVSGTSHASVLPAVPEIDAGTAVIAIGLTVGIVALIREYRRKK